jgi:long-chain acyl-CoA synthetase
VARALEIIRSATRSPEAVHPDANIELALGLDSMERVELLTQLQLAFETRVDEETAHKIYTVRELVDACLAGSASGAGGETAAEAAGDPWEKILQEDVENDPVLRELLPPRPLVAAFFFVLLKLVYAFAWLFLGFRVRGREHLPEKGPFLLCPNHETYLDAFLLLSALPYRHLKDLFFVGASEYFQAPLMAWIARRTNVVPVDPDANLIRAMQAGAFGLRHGKILTLFPEGERTIDGEIKKFKKGAAILSLNLDVPVVPVALKNVFEIWPRGRSIHWASLIPGSSSRGRARMAFGEPVKFSRDELAAAARDSKPKPRPAEKPQEEIHAAEEAGAREQGRAATAVATAPPPPKEKKEKEEDAYSLAAEKLRSIVVSLQESLGSS